MERALFHDDERNMMQNKLNFYKNENRNDNRGYIERKGKNTLLLVFIVP